MSRGPASPPERMPLQTESGSAASTDGGSATVTHTAPSPTATTRGAVIPLTTRALFVRGSMR